MTQRDVPEEPHRPLVDAVLSNSAARAAWLVDGGPEPRLPASWAALWEAAVARQMLLADQTEPEAQRAVSTLTSHLSALQHNAAWFRADDRLREQAIAETLLYVTRLRTAVRSRPAQLAWHHRRDPATEMAWLDAWKAWADER
ncbi:hypothetical protein O7635_31110 [Asanoa sp. WMMD1127]|uniref:hypothetical protein n=1 Tax=Asanoa sp. WMMD1127 TaxID=3016107 RepID=UPI0024180A2A|nr:hypothetical protein [Asanoa sp. WMMD1127]MDG4826322.1 hypothetical protein [Asanoa sp. WMMD1127]